MLTRCRGDFDEMLGDCDLIVELIGGVDPARDYVLRAMAAGKHVVTANKQLLSQHGEELWAAAREHGVQLRFEAAVAGVVPVIRVLQESLAAAHVERIHGIVNGTTNFILTQMAQTGAAYEEALAEAQRLGYAEADPTDDVNGTDAAAKMAILARLAFDTPVHLDQVRYEGIEHLTADDMEYARELGLGAQADRHRRAHRRGLTVRVHPAFLYGGHPLASRRRPVQRRHDRVRGDHRDHDDRPRRRRPADRERGARRRHQRDDPARLDAGRRGALAIVEDVESAFYLHLEVDDRAGRARAGRAGPRLQGASVKSVVQKGLGENARLVMVVHPVLESRFFAAVEMIAELDFVRARPRAIRVIEEEFVWRAAVDGA